MFNLCKDLKTLRKLNIHYFWLENYKHLSNLEKDLIMRHFILILEDQLNNVVSVNQYRS